MTEQEVIEELRRCAGTQFDPKLVKDFIRIITKERELTLPRSSFS